MKEASKVISIIAKKMCGIFSLAVLPLGTCAVWAQELPVIGLHTSRSCWPIRLTPWTWRMEQRHTGRQWELSQSPEHFSETPRAGPSAALPTGGCLLPLSPWAPLCPSVKPIFLLQSISVTQIQRPLVPKKNWSLPKQVHLSGKLLSNLFV